MGVVLSFFLMGEKKKRRARVSSPPLPLSSSPPLPLSPSPPLQLLTWLIWSLANSVFRQCTFWRSSTKA